MSDESDHKPSNSVADRQRLVTAVWLRELGVLVNWSDILDGEIVSAAWAVGGYPSAEGA
jgi:hypothetical protein